MNSISRRAVVGAPFVLRAANRRPNLVLFISDDHGYGDSPLYGNRDLETPNLSRLARTGTVHTNTFAGSPACQPGASCRERGYRGDKGAVFGTPVLDGFGAGLK